MLLYSVYSEVKKEIMAVFGAVFVIVVVDVVDNDVKGT